MRRHLLQKKAYADKVDETPKETDDYLSSPAELTPEEQGLIEEQKIPTSHEFEIFEDKPKKSLASVFAAMAERRRKG